MKAAGILKEKGYEVNRITVIPNDYKVIHSTVLKAVRESDAVLVIGGTGPSPRDISVDVVEKLSWRHLPGFGELFRYRTYEEIGFKAVYTRAGLYLVDGSAVVVIPGSPNAVDIALEILSGTIDHVIEEARRIKGKHRNV